MPRELIIVTGPAGTGKTTFAKHLAEDMRRRGSFALSFDQDLEEDNRLIARELIRAVTSCETVSQDLKRSCQEIFSASRPTLLQSLCTSAAYHLNQANVVLAANFREDDMSKHGFKQLLGRFLSEYSEEPVSVIGVHLQANEQQGLQRIEHRNVPNDKYEVIHDPAAYSLQCEKYAGNGPLFNEDPGKSLQSMTLYPFGKTPDDLIKEFYQTLETITPYQISPLIGPRLPCTDNSCYPRLFPTLMK